jgi:hypothetical protein
MLWQEQKKTNAKWVKIIASFVSFISVGIIFQLQPQHNWFLCFSIDIVIYTALFPNRRNARNWAGVKIYRLCGWVGLH